MKQTLIILFLTFVSCLPAQLTPQFTHYSVDDGLSENNVVSICQDRKGLMWLGTYDGLNRFDGYTFRTYKGKPGQPCRLANYRVDKIKEDKFGYLWLQTYDGRIYRFDPKRERFTAVPQCSKRFEDYKSPLKDIEVMADGSVWLWNKGAGSSECFRVESRPASEQLSVDEYAPANESLPQAKINTIFQDSQQTTWILSDKGISSRKAGHEQSPRLYRNSEGLAVYSAFEQDAKLYFGSEKGKLLIYDLKKGIFEQITSPVPGKIIDIKKLHTDELLLVYQQSGLMIYNPSSQRFTPVAVTSLPGNEILGCYQDKKGDVWLDTRFQGAVVLGHADRKLRYLPTSSIDEYSPSVNPVFKVIEDSKNHLWVLTRTGGFYWYNRVAERLEPFYNDPKSVDRKFSNLLHTALLDKEGNLWLSTFSQGIDKVGFRQSAFRFVRPFDLPVYSIRNEIRSVFRDSRGRTWLGSRKGFVYLYDEHQQFKGLVGFDGRINGAKPINVPVYGITESHDGSIWLCSKGMGLFQVQNEGPDRFKVSNFQYNADDIYSLSSNAVYSVYEDGMKRIWVATFGGGINLMERAGAKVQFISKRNKLRNYPIDDCQKTRYITGDKHGHLYVGTTGGLLIFKADRSAPENIHFQRFWHNPAGRSDLSGNDVQYILASTRGDLYLALFGGGLNVLKGGYHNEKHPQFQVYDKGIGMFSNVIYTLKEDADGQIWMTSQSRIIRFDPHANRFDTYKPIHENNYFFVEAAACKAPTGEILYGTSDGFVSFHPNEIIRSGYIPRICFTQLQLFNKPADPGDENSPLQQTIDDSPELTLQHQQTVFSIEYAAIDFKNPGGIQYAYRLDGIDKDWNFVGAQRVATYTNLPRGKYVFHVKSTNSDGEWVDNERSITIEKLPSFWESAWGWLFYVCVFILLLGGSLFILLTIYKLRNDVEVEQRITQMKLRFFTDISHELRTPLTLIASPVESILEKELLTENVRNQLTVVKRNTDRMLRLINQILDFRKIQNKKMNLVIEQVQLYDFMMGVCNNFSKLAEEKNIQLSIDDRTNQAVLWADCDKLEKIMYNLLSNAFKFSRESGLVHLILAETDSELIISIRDNGLGISSDKLKLLFDRFESFASQQGVNLQASTGIGLSLTRELVEMHHGQISVESESGKGTVFHLKFRKGVEHFGTGDHVIIRELTEELASAQTPVNDFVSGSVTAMSDIPTILIAEDNDEMRVFLKSSLSSTYFVLEAINGTQALELAQKHSPDLIVSDIMMPDMDGMELTAKIKSDLSISHIPIILLTAKTDMESKLEALDKGVDDYITKPFSPIYLEARIENLLRLRGQLQHYFQHSVMSGMISIAKPHITTQDDVFMQKIMKYIEENYIHTDMSIDAMAAFTGLSRSSFFKKMKSITGLAPVDFIKEFRVQRAMQMLEAGETNISQIAYNVGMDDPRYFSKCFKQKYGYTPREYRMRMNATKPEASGE